MKHDLPPWGLGGNLVEPEDRTRCMRLLSRMGTRIDEFTNVMPVHLFNFVERACLSILSGVFGGIMLRLLHGDRPSLVVL